MLPIDTFKTVVENAPLFAIDLVVINEECEILVGKRLNAPAKDWWFVPGGRVLKDETMDTAFKRICELEIGSSYERGQAQLLGIYEHFYYDSFCCKNTSTHYVNATHSIQVDRNCLDLPRGEQHFNYRWVAISDVEKDESIHNYSKIFMLQLVERLNLKGYI